MPSSILESKVNNHEHFLSIERKDKDHLVWHISYAPRKGQARYMVLSNNQKPNSVGYMKVYR